MSTIAEKVEFTVDEMNGYAHYREHKTVARGSIIS